MLLVLNLLVKIIKIVKPGNAPIDGHCVHLVHGGSLSSLYVSPTEAYGIPGGSQDLGQKLLVVCLLRSWF